MDKYFRIETLASTPNPQQLCWLAMHQDYSAYPVFDTINRIPNETKSGQLLVDKCLKFAHFGIFEHPQITFNCIGFPHDTVMQLRTHRVGVSFDVQCLAGDTEVSFLTASGAVRKIPIGQLYDLWTNGEKAVRERKIKGRNGELPGEYRRDCKKRLSKMKLRVLNEDTNVFETSHIKEVFARGKSPVYKVTLEDGKTLKCTLSHRILTEEGWKTLQEAMSIVVDEQHKVISFNTNNFVCNGQIVGDGCYRDKEWLSQRLQMGYNSSQLAQEGGCSVESIKKWVYKHGLSLNKVSVAKNLPNIPWNTGKKYSLNLSPEQQKKWSDASKQKTRRGKDSNFWKGGVTLDREAVGAWTRQNAKFVHEKYNYVCQLCSRRGVTLHAHHLIPVYADASKAYDFNNLVSLCVDCHKFIHNNDLESQFIETFTPDLTGLQLPPKPRAKGNQTKGRLRKATRVDFVGIEETYDLEVGGNWHNFVGNSVVVHNSQRYTSQGVLDVAYGNKDFDEVFYLRPIGFYTDRQGAKYEYTEERRKQHKTQALNVIAEYAYDLAQGMSEEHARGLLPQCIRQHFVLSCNGRSLMHLLDVRHKKDVQLECQQFCELLFKRFQEWMPEVANYYAEKRLGKNRLAP